VRNELGEANKSSFKGEDGRFGEPTYTIPDIDDEDPNLEAE